MKWITAFDLDFSAQSNATFATDGYYTIGGYQFTKGNSANEAASASIINGTGLNFQPASSSDYNGTTRTLPYLWLPFSQFLPTTLDWDTAFRIYVSMGNDNSNVQYDSEVFGVDTNSTLFAFLVKRGQGTTGQGVQMLYDLNGGNTNNFSTDLFTTNSNAVTGKTYCLQFPNMFFQNGLGFRADQISAGTHFPALNGTAYTISLMDILTQSPNGIQNWAPFAFFNSNLGIILGAQRALSGTSLSVNFQRLRFDYKV